MTNPVSVSADASAILGDASHLWFEGFLHEVEQHFDRGSTVVVEAVPGGGLSSFMRQVWRHYASAGAAVITRGSVRDDSILKVTTSTGSATGEVREILAFLAAREMGDRGVLIVDDAHRMPTAALGDLLDGFFASGIAHQLVLGSQPVLCAPLTRDLLSDLPERADMSLPRLTTEQVVRILGDAWARLDEDAQQVVLHIVAGVPARAHHLRCQISRTSHPGTLRTSKVENICRGQIAEDIRRAYAACSQRLIAVALCSLLGGTEDLHRASFAAGIHGAALSDALEQSDALGLFTEHQPTARVVGLALSDVVAERLDYPAQRRLAEALLSVGISHQMATAAAPVQTSGAGATELSEAELRVAQQVSAGKTNRQVADDLFLSKRTVDTHLRNIFRKLGIESRQELSELLIKSGAATA